jgi:tetratricopeptide (TPR) repeat protein
LGKLKLAEKEFKFALKANPSHTPSLYNLALIYKDKGDYEKAFWFASKIKGLAQRFYTKGLIYMDKKDYPKAVIYLKRAAEKDKNKSFIYIQLGNAYQLQGKLKEAISAYKRALELEPDNIQLKTTIKRLSATD